MIPLESPCDMLFPCMPRIFAHVCLVLCLSTHPPVVPVRSSCLPFAFTTPITCSNTGMVTHADSLLLLLGALCSQCTFTPRQCPAAAAATAHCGSLLRLVQHRRHLSSWHNDSTLCFGKSQQVLF